MTEIKPRMVDGEAWCYPSCPHYGAGEGADIPAGCYENPQQDFCAPYYRARVAALEQQIETPAKCEQLRSANIDALHTLKRSAEQWLNKISDPEREPNPPEAKEWGPTKVSVRDVDLVIDRSPEGVTVQIRYGGGMGVLWVPVDEGFQEPPWEREP